MVERNEDRQQTPPSLKLETAQDWRLDEEAHKEAVKRFDNLHEQTRRLTREIIEVGGGQVAGEVISMHERINRIIERSLELGGRDEFSVELVDSLYQTITALDDGLTEGKDNEVRERLERFSIKGPQNELPRVVDKFIEQEAGSAGKRRVEDWRAAINRPLWKPGGTGRR